MLAEKLTLQLLNIPGVIVFKSFLWFRLYFFLLQFMFKVFILMLMLKSGVCYC